MDRDPFDLVGDVLDGQFRVDAFAEGRPERQGTTRASTRPSPSSA